MSDGVSSESVISTCNGMLSCVLTGMRIFVDSLVMSL